MSYEGHSPNITARVFMLKSELARVFDNRIANAKDMLVIARECMDNRKIDMALQYYYWAYSLIRSVQFPNEVKDENGKILINWIPFRIEQILSDINVAFDKKDGDFANLRFTYQGAPVSSLEFNYSDGRTMCQGIAKDGMGVIEMIPEYETDTYHLNIEYEYKGQAIGDAEMKSVLDVVTPKIFPKSEVVVDARKHIEQPTVAPAEPALAEATQATEATGATQTTQTAQATPTAQTAQATVDNTAAEAAPIEIPATTSNETVAQNSHIADNNNSESTSDIADNSAIVPPAPVAETAQSEPAADEATAAQPNLDIPDSAAYVEAINNVVNAITNKHYASVHSSFTLDGLQMFNRLTGYGKARILDSSNIRFYKGLNGSVVARGLKMSFSFTGSRKKTFVEDISFTFNDEHKIENVAFGLGVDAECGIFNKKAAWTTDMRELVVSFLENYKTAYSLERLDYIRDIFADDAVIIVGNIVKRNNAHALDNGINITSKGEDIITYNRYSKDDYLKNLAKCFNRNDFINLRFTSHDIQWLDKLEDQTVMAINIRQEYNSSTYADEGYLFLIVDMTNIDAPQIRVRTWQPNEVAIDKLYKAGDFFND
jgi:hypothetical protein